MGKERKLTDKELNRAERVETLSEKLVSEGYERKNHNLSVSYLSGRAIGIGLISCAIFGWIFWRRYGLHSAIDTPSGLCLALTLVQFFVHECIHGLFWGMFAPNRYKTIELGIILSKFTPYCYCGEPLTKNQYIIGLLMPTIVLGIIPCLVSVFTGSFILLVLGVFGITGGGGDLTIIYKLLRYKTDASELIIMDHPTECGFISFEK